MREFTLEYAKLYQLLYDTLPLATYISEDPYLKRSKMCQEMLSDYRNSKELVSVELVQRIMLKKALEKVPSAYHEHPVYLDRVMAAEFKLKNRHENSSESLTIFSQVYYNYRGHLLKMKNCNS